MQSNLKQIHNNKITWYHATRPTDEDLQYLKEKFGFHPLDMADVKTVSSRPKLDEYEDYIFMVLLFAYYNRQTREVLPTEVNFFIGKDYLVTSSDGHTSYIDDFFKLCLTDDVVKKQYMSEHPVQLLHEILHQLQAQTYPMLDHVSRDIENIERQIFSGNEKQMVSEILTIKRNIVGFRRIMQSHKNIIKKLMATRTKFFMPDEMNSYFAEALERSKDIWDYLETHKETIEAFAETNESMISYKLNDIMRMLTIISVILMPATLVASVFGMNTKVMPFVYHPQGFWILVGLMSAMILSFLAWFKRKGWL